MSRDEFDALVKRLEPFAATHPRAYFARVVLLAGVGYAFWFLILGGMLAALAGVIALMVWSPETGKVAVLLGLALVVMMGAILRSLRVHIEPPDGFEVHRSQSPPLFALLDDLSRQLRAPRFHHVQLTGDHNAAVVQVPRLGALGWQRNFLILGLPLMQGLTPDQFRAVVAHEFAHLSGNHSRFACWIYRVRKSWEQVLQRMMAENHVGTGVFLKFFRWYAPYFNAYTFVLARRNEYEADRAAAALVGTEITGQALIHVRVYARFMEESFWPGISRSASQQAAPEIGAYARLGELLRQGPEPALADKWLRQALTIETNNSDTHPCLRDRLRAIGYLEADTPAERVARPPVPATTAATLLGDTLPACIRALEIRWEQATQHQWKERYRRAEQQRTRLKGLREEEGLRALSVDEQCERAHIVLELEGQRQAIPLLQRLIADAPDHPQANFLLGRMLVEEDDESGIAMLEKALESDFDLAKPSYDLLYRFYRRSGRRENVHALERRYDDHQESLSFARQERQSVHLSDTFVAHGLGAQQVDDIRQQLSSYPEIARAYLVRKQVAFFPRKPFYVMVVELTEAASGPELTLADQRLVDRLAEQLRLPGQTLIFTPKGRLEPIGRIIRLESWTLFYERARPVAASGPSADVAASRRNAA